MHLKNLSKIRKEKGWSQEMLAQKAGISYNTLIKIDPLHEEFYQQALSH